MMGPNLFNLRINEKKSGIILRIQRFDPLIDPILYIPLLKSSLSIQFVKLNLKVVF
jgi:hypothetical protein